MVWELCRNSRPGAWASKANFFDLRDFGIQIFRLGASRAERLSFQVAPGHPAVLEDPMQPRGNRKGPPLQGPYDLKSTHACMHMYYQMF